MNISTISALRHINTQFYQQEANSFGKTRLYPWPGWDHAFTGTDFTTSGSILDVGCGNGRLAGFLQQKTSAWSYIGLDESAGLVSQAKETYQTLKNFRFRQVDILNMAEIPEFTPRQFNLVCAFGLLHHIPSFLLRLQVIKTIIQATKPKGRIIFSLWNFGADSRFEAKKIAWSTLQTLAPQIVIDERDLEANDFLLRWQQSLYPRYAHFIDKVEAQRLISSLNHISIENDFLADGKTGKLNRYLVLQKML